MMANSRANGPEDKAEHSPVQLKGRIYLRKIGGVGGGPQKATIFQAIVH